MLQAIRFGEIGFREVARNPETGNFKLGISLYGDHARPGNPKYLAGGPDSPDLGEEFDLYVDQTGVVGHNIHQPETEADPVPASGLIRLTREMLGDGLFEQYREVPVVRQALAHLARLLPEDDPRTDTIQRTAAFMKLDEMA